MATEEVSQRIKDWLEGIREDLQLDDRDLEQLDVFLQQEFDSAETMSDSNPGDAYGRILGIASISSKAASKKPLMIRVFMKYLNRFVNIMNKVQHAMGAVSFSIGVSFPFDIELVLNF